jgi:hypothetical protein
MKKENSNARFFRDNPTAGAYRIVEGKLIPTGTSSIKSKMRFSDDIGAGHEEGGVVYNAIHGIEED